MAWTTPRTWTNVVVSASDLNTDIRDNLGILKTRIADNGNPLFDRAGGAAKTTTYNAATSDIVIDCAGSVDWVLTLYAASGNAGRVLFLRNTGTATVTVDGNASETVDGATTVPLYPGTALTLWCNGTAWFSLGNTGGLVQASTTSYSTATTSTSATYADSGLTVSHTPKHASNVLIAIAVVACYNDAGAHSKLKLLQDSTAIAEYVGMVADTPVQVSLIGSAVAGGTAAQTWKVQFARNAGANNARVNAAENGGVANQASWLTIQEFRRCN